MYLSDQNNIPTVLQLTELSLDELEQIVGRFAKHSWRAGQLRGEVVQDKKGNYIIRHHFTKKLLWRLECTE